MRVVGDDSVERYCRPSIGAILSQWRQLTLLHHRLATSLGRVDNGDIMMHDVAIRLSLCTYRAALMV